MIVSSKNILDGQNLSSYTDSDLTIIDNLSELQDMPSAVKMESYVVALLVKGSASFYINDKSYEMSSDQIFIFSPFVTLERTMLSADAEYYIIVITPQYSQKLTSITGSSGWDILMYLSQNPIIPLSQKQTWLFIQYYNLLYHKLKEEHKKHHREVVDAIFSAMLYEFHDIIEHDLKLAVQSFSSSKTIFHNFYEKLNSTTPKYQKVEYYAKLLNITPKYLSAICKKLTGKTAMQIITDAVVKDIILLLKNEQLSVKEITQQAGFPNQSFLGSYVRKHLGMSPQKYREQLHAKH